MIEVVDNQYPEKVYTVNIEFPEFTCVCPKTGLPDFATIKIEYVPGKKLVELKEKYKINPAGEGGEMETTVLDAPFFKKKIKILDSETDYKENSGIFIIKKAGLVKK